MRYRLDPVSACEKDSDCALRAGSQCCEPCTTGTYELIAINASQRGELSKQVCGPTTGCVGCVPSYPAEAKATCDLATKHCKVTSM